MIKPQGKIRPPVDDGLEYDDDSEDDDSEDDDAPVRISVDSYGGEVLSRDEGGRELLVKIPDFTIVKATYSLHSDNPLLIVEVKRANEPLDLAQEQMAKYLDSFLAKTTITGTPLAESLQGLLVVGSDFYIVTQENRNTQAEFSHPYTITDHPLYDFLAAIADANA